MKNLIVHLLTITVLSVCLIVIKNQHKSLSNSRNFLSYRTNLEATLHIINNENHKKIDVLATILEKNQEAKHFLDRAKQQQAYFAIFNKAILNIEKILNDLDNPFYNEENDSLQFSEYVTNYKRIKHQHQIQSIFLENIPKLVEDYQKLKRELQTLFQDTTHISHWDTVFYHQWIKSNQITVDSTFSLLQFFETEEKLNQYTKKFDFFHLALFLKAVKTEVQTLSYFLTKNISILIDKHDMDFQKPYQYIISAYSDDKPEVGKPFKLNFSVFPYIPSNRLEMSINRIPIPVKEGIGYYKIPNNYSYEDIQATISFVHPKTQKRERYMKKDRHLIGSFR